MVDIITIEKNDRTPEQIEKLLPVWERSVRATHIFLSNEEILQIKNYVPMAFSGVEHLLVAQDEHGAPVGFMGINDHSLEILFLDPEHRGHGLGRKLLEYGIAHYDVQTLAVNEQNPRRIHKLTASMSIWALRSLSALSLTSKVSLIHCCTCAVRSKPHSCSTM